MSATELTALNIRRLGLPLERMDEFYVDLFSLVLSDSDVIPIITRHRKLGWLCSSHWVKAVFVNDAVTMNALFDAKCPMRPLPDAEGDDWYERHYDAIANVWRQRVHNRCVLSVAWRKLYFRVYRKAFALGKSGRKRDRDAYECDVAIVN